MLSTRPEHGDWIRAGRVYYHGGDWEKAKHAFDQALKLAPKNEDHLAEVGAYYNLQGEREKAGELFQKSFAIKPYLKNMLNAAGSYVGVPPRIG